jgi:ssDNA-binding replication factor A large subunit
VERQISTSPRKYQLARSPEVSLSEVENISDTKRIAVVVKVTKVADREEVKPGLFKQDLMIGDSTGYIRLTVWQEDIDKLHNGHSYLLHNLVVKSFNGSKYLGTPKTGLHTP